ncbi:MAG: hypothetical protein HZB32_03655 [Nitrospirae bacterium]|nr:hypothetical protein [Nitrospirota bacterium]
MEQNWILKEANKVRKSSNVVILEKPDVKRYLNGLLLKRFWPVIYSSLEASDYVYFPESNPETEWEEGHTLTRSLTFMLSDGRYTFFRGNLSCSTEGWMLEREFNLSLSRENDLQVIIEILGNSRFAGYPPTLSIDRVLDKKGADFYQITFHAGSGTGWGYGEEYVDEKIRKIIDVNIRMYDFAMDSIITPQDLGEFLTIAYEAYEVY